MHKISIINSHPIQYFAPLYARMAIEKDIDLEVLYCDDHGLNHSHDTQFGINFSWDIPLLQGYDYEFFKNYMPGGFSNESWRTLNPGIIARLIRTPRRLVILHGWNNLTNILAIIAGKLKGHTICLKGESAETQESQKPKTRNSLKKAVLKFLLFPLTDYFLYIGQENKAFYKNLGIAEDRLVFSPYCVDNDRFSNAFHQLKDHRQSLRKKLGLPENKKLILFVGKYIEKKRPLDLLKAFRHLPAGLDAGIVFVGEGNLRPQMEAFIAKHRLRDIHLTGFVNQSRIPEYYSACDLFVMCSGIGETWGLAVNEAMNFHLPLIVSKTTGCSRDLVREGENGFTFKTGDHLELASRIRHLLSLPREKIALMGRRSAEIVGGYSYEVNIAHLKKLNAGKSGATNG